MLGSVLTFFFMKDSVPLAKRRRIETPTKAKPGELHREIFHIFCLTLI